MFARNCIVPFVTADVCCCNVTHAGIFDADRRRAYSACASTSCVWSLMSPADPAPFALPVICPAVACVIGPSAVFHAAIA